MVPCHKPPDHPTMPCHAMPWRLAAQMRVSGCGLDLEDTILAAKTSHGMEENHGKMGKLWEYYGKIRGNHLLGKSNAIFIIHMD